MSDLRTRVAEICDAQSIEDNKTLLNRLITRALDPEVQYEERATCSELADLVQQKINDQRNYLKRKQHETTTKH